MGGMIAGKLQAVCCPSWCFPAGWMGDSYYGSWILGSIHTYPPTRVHPHLHLSQVAAGARRVKDLDRRPWYGQGVGL